MSGLPPYLEWLTEVAEKDVAKEAVYRQLKQTLRDVSGRIEKGYFGTSKAQREFSNLVKETKAMARALDLVSVSQAVLWRTANEHPRSDRTTGGNDAEVRFDGPEQPKESVDERGFVKNPADPTAFMGVAEITRQEWCMHLTTKQIDHILERHPEIRRWKPSKARKSVHLGDLLDYLDNRSRADDPKDIEARRTKLREIKSSRR